MSFPTVTDVYERIEFDGVWGRARLVVLRTDAGPAICEAELERILGEGGGEGGLGERYGVPTRPLPDENAILLLEMLGAVQRNRYSPLEEPPRVMAMRYVLDVVARAWQDSEEPRRRAAAASFYAANERRRLVSFQRLDLCCSGSRSPRPPSSSTARPATSTRAGRSTR